MSVIQSGERRLAPASVARVGEFARYRIALLRAEASLGSTHLARLGLVVLTCALQTLVLWSPGHFRPASNGFFAVGVTFGTLASLVVAFAGTIPLQKFTGLGTRRLLAYTALWGVCALSIVGVVRGVQAIRAATQGSPYSNDGAVMDLYAAERLLHGHNPYVKTNIVTALAAIDAPSTTTTPLMDGQFRGSEAYPSEPAIQQVFLNVLRHRSQHGVPIPLEFESKYNYPAGSFLFILPFVWAGMHDMRFLYLLAILGMGSYLWKRMPQPSKILVPLLILANVPLIVLAAGGQPDPLYGLFLLLGFAEWRSSWTSPLAMGVAVGTKQLAWFFLPFYLILVIRRFGWKEGVRRTGVLGSVSLAMNLPFILLSPDGYITSVSGPVVDPMFPLGIGIIALFVSGVVPMLPKFAFMLMEIVAWIGSAAFFARNRSVLAAGGVVLAVLPLFFAWRSLVSYFYLVPFLALAVSLADETVRHPSQRNS